MLKKVVIGKILSRAKQNLEQTKGFHLVESLLLLLTTTSLIKKMKKRKVKK